MSVTGVVVELDDASWPHSPMNQVTSPHPDLRQRGRCDLGAAWLYRQSRLLQKPMHSGGVEVSFDFTKLAGRRQRSDGWLRRVDRGGQVRSVSSPVDGGKGSAFAFTVRQKYGISEFKQRS
jgi:hypothetical protein